MPNHIKSIVKISGKPADIVKLKDAIKMIDSEDGKEYPIDFERIIPMPENIYRGNLGQAEELKYGKANCWYDWSIKNWGTKWNAYSQHWISENEFTFQTAWSCPVPIYDKLAEMFPQIKFKVRYADEDRGSNCGKFELSNGILKYDPKSPSGDGDKQSNDFARRVWES